MVPIMVTQTKAAVESTTQSHKNRCNPPCEHTQHHCQTNVNLQVRDGPAGTQSVFLSHYAPDVTSKSIKCVVNPKQEQRVFKFLAATLI